LSGRLVLETYNLRDRDPNLSVIDQKLETKFRQILKAVMPAKVAAQAS
jgi:hypothetical protein